MRKADKNPMFKSTAVGAELVEEKVKKYCEGRFGYVYFRKGREGSSFEEVSKKRAVFLASIDEEEKGDYRLTDIALYKAEKGYIVAYAAESRNADSMKFSFYDELKSFDELASAYPKLAWKLRASMLLRQ